MLGPFIPLVDRLGRLASALAPGVDRVEVEYFGRIAERDTRLLTLAALQGVLSGHCEEEVNLVNAQSLAEERGIGVSERTESVARDFTDLVRITIVCGDERYRVAGTTLGRRHRPHLLEAWGQRFNLQLDEGAHLALFRYPNRPGMLGRVGSRAGRARDQHLQRHAGRAARRRRPEDGHHVMLVVTDADIPDAGARAVLAEPGVLDGRSRSGSDASRLLGRLVPGMHDQHVAVHPPRHALADALPQQSLYRADLARADRRPGRRPVLGEPCDRARRVARRLDALGLDAHASLSSDVASTTAS